MSGEGRAGNSRAADEFDELRLHLASSAFSSSVPSFFQRFLAKPSSSRLTISIA